MILRADKQIQQSGKIKKNQHTKINSFPLHNNELTEKETRKTIPLKMTFKRRYQGINLTNKVKSLHNEDYRTLKKKNKKALKNGKTSLANVLAELILLKLPYFQKQYTDSMLSLLKYQQHFSHNWKKALKFI